MLTTRIRSVEPIVRRTGPIIQSAKTRIALSIVALYRSLLRRTIFIGVTGSCGKTTTKELIAAVLAARFRGRKSHSSKNLPRQLARTILGVRPWDDYCVVEIAAAVRGTRIPLEGPLTLVQPQIGVVTNIESDHLSAFGTVEEIAAEKGKLIAALPPHGTAILNIDNEHVRAMQTRCAARIITCGLSPDAMLRAEDIQLARATVVYGHLRRPTLRRTHATLRCSLGTFGASGFSCGTCDGCATRLGDPGSS